MLDTSIFFKEGAVGKFKGGYYFRTPQLNKFLIKLEGAVGEVVGFRFSDNNVEVVVNPPDSNT